MVWFRKFALARTAWNGGYIGEGNNEVIQDVQRMRWEKYDEGRKTEINGAMDTQEEQFSSSDFIYHLKPDKKQISTSSPGSISPENRQSMAKVVPQTIIRPVPVMRLDTSVYSYPPTYIDNIPLEVNVPVMHSSFLATQPVTNGINLLAKHKTEVRSTVSHELQQKTFCENVHRLPKCRWFMCERQFRNMDELVVHVNGHHVRVERPDVEYQCKWDGCPRKGKGFNARYKMLIHIRTHTNEKPHKCSQCGKAFSRPEYIKIHMRSHTGEKPYSCPFEGCNKAYSNSSDRFKHVKTHQEDKPYICKMPGCSKRYTDPSSRRKHVRTHGHRYEIGCQISAASFPINSNPIDDNSIEALTNSSADYSMSVMKAENVSLVVDSGSQKSSCDSLVLFKSDITVQSDHHKFK